VVSKNPETNELFVTNEYDKFALERKEAVLTHFNWIPEKPERFKNLNVKIRHGPDFCKAQLAEQDGHWRITLSSKDQGLAPGQFVAFYDDTYCYGCGVIADAHTS
jgi:tRNA-specific 2-thiouridylase